MEETTLSSSPQQEGMLIASGKRLTIENTAEFAQQIRAGLAESKSVAIQFDPNIEVDITSLQVLCAACKTAVVEKKVLSCRGELPKALIDLVAAAGAEFHGVCKHNKGGRCFWSGGRV
ncbi:MAG: STAS domain-containing protein [Desulfobulbaceae bacterium]|nr:STAS domain-containing protein [Desulfobulbaceae bacterium]